MKKNKAILNNGSGLTLIELSVAVFIFIILAILLTYFFIDARQRSRDIKRLADVRLIQAALESYYNNCNRYPASVMAGDTIGQGDGVCNGESVYLFLVPTNPMPTDHSSCAGSDESSRVYTYQVVDNPVAGNSYTLKYCLGKEYDNISAGIHTASPGNIK